MISVIALRYLVFSRNVRSEGMIFRYPKAACRSCALMA
jgi:hypothetical protein